MYKYLYLFTAFTLLCNVTPAFAGKETFTINIRARVISPTDYGMTQDEWEAVNIVGSSAWQTKQCCMTELYNQTHERQVEHEYCYDNRIVKWMNNGICGVML
jgi:hypothetical protein